MRPHDDPLVSVVIPCYNQARFLDAAIASVLSQSYAAREVIVVDDGSTDDPASVAAVHGDVICLRQPNLGRCAARNAGARAARGQFLVFLDADDRLLPDALATGVAHLRARADCALVAGHRVLIDAAGGRVAAPLPVCPPTHDYLTLLQTNFILAPAAAMFRKSAFTAAGGWDERLHAAEDYELYLRLARRWAIACHHAEVAEYRRHDTNTSANAALMLLSTLTVVAMQRQEAYSRAGGVAAFRAAMTGWWRFWARQLIEQIGRRLRENPWQSDILRDVGALVRASAPVLVARLRWKITRMLAGPAMSRSRTVVPPHGPDAQLRRRGEPCHRLPLARDDRTSADERGDASDRREAPPRQD